MCCDREKTSKLEAGSAHKAAWKPQGVAEQHGVTQKETNTNVSCLLEEKKKGPGVLQIASHYILLIRK